MRLIEIKGSGELTLTKNFTEDIPRYAILSHTWGGDDDEVTFADFIAGAGLRKAGYRKIEFCQKQAAEDGLKYFWVDTCCINKSDPAELSEAINSMFSWYRDAVKCYVYLIDVSTRGPGAGKSISRSVWGLEFRQSRWFTRAWTLQELIAPATVEFFSREGERLGDKVSEEASLEKITGIPIEVFRGKSIVEYTVDQWMIWATERTAKRKEDEAYCLLGIFDVHMSLNYGEGRAKAFARLQGKIRNQSRFKHNDPTTIVRGNTHWMVPRAVNGLFTGRAELLARIQQALHVEITYKSAKQRRFVITGLGGQGKSEVCLQVASYMQEKFWGIFWVDVGTPSTAKRDFITLAKLVGCTVETVSEALHVLANSQQSWLLILDNADDPDYDYQAYLPSGNRGSILITSRVATCKRYSPEAFEALEGLNDRESEELLLKAAEISRESWPLYDFEAKRIVQLLASHTLALIQAGAYIAQGHCHLNEYVQVFQRQRERLMKYHSKQARSRYGDVYATFEASAEALEQSQSEAATDALCLLEILSMLDSSVLPLQIFEEAWKGCKEVSQTNDKGRGIDEFSRDHVLRLPKLMVADDDEWDQFRLTEASSLLASLSLATRQDLNSCMGLSMHPLTHAWAKDRQDSKRQGVAWIATGCILGFSRSNTRIWQTQERHLLPHFLSYSDLKVKKAFDFASKTVITSILLRCGWALLDMRQDRRLGQLLGDMFLELRQKPDKPSEDLLPLYDLQASSLLALGRNEAARGLLEQLLRMRQTTQPKTHPFMLTTMSNLALVLNRQGKYAAAEAMNRQTLEISEEVLSKTHPHTLKIMSNLALVLNRQGKYAAAEAMNRQTLEISKEVLGKTHPDTLITMSNLAGVLDMQGKYAAAEAMNRQALKISEEVLGKTHPNTITSVYCLAYLLQKKQDYEEASLLYQRACTGYKLSLGSEHPTTKACINDYSIMLSSL